MTHSGFVREVVHRLDDRQARHQPRRQRWPAGIVVIDFAQPLFQEAPVDRLGELQAVREALVLLWEASDRICGKRLKPLIPLPIPAMKRHGHLSLDEVVRVRLVEISAATIDRILAPVRAGGSGGRRRRNAHSSAVRRSVPIRTYADWDDPAPGYMEADLVAHSGPSASGSFVQTLTLTDVATVPLQISLYSVLYESREICKIQLL